MRTNKKVVFLTQILISILASLLLHVVSCRSIAPAGKMSETEKTLEPFSEVEIADNISANISINALQKLTIICDEALLSCVKIEVHAGVLKISNKQASSGLSVKILLQAPEMRKISLSDSAFAKVAKVKSDINVVLQDDSHLELAGFCENLDAELSNASSLDALQLVSQNVTLKIRDSAKAKIIATKKLKLFARGASYTQIFGHPAVFLRKTSNAARYSFE